MRHVSPFGLRPPICAATRLWMGGVVQLSYNTIIIHAATFTGMETLMLIVVGLFGASGGKYITLKTLST